MQISLFADAAPSLDPALAGVRRLPLAHGAWLEHLPGWVRGHERLLLELRDGVAWRAGQREMYGRVVEVPRLVARLPADGPIPPVIAQASQALSARHGRPLDRVSAALYRGGDDSVAWHGDRVGARRRDTVVAILSLGEPRRFLLRPRGGGRSLAFDLGCGDLLVMGGTCQATWEHAVPKRASAGGPRVSVQLREVAL